MALNPKFKTKEEVPVELLPHCAERDGLWQLEVEGYVEKSKVDEVRNNNTALLKQIEEQKKRFEGIDPDEFRKLADEKRQLEEAQQIKAGEFEKVVENRVKGLKADWDKQVAALSSERDSLNGRLTAIQIDQGVITAATKRGLRPTAIMDITARAVCIQVGEWRAPCLRGRRPDASLWQGWHLGHDFGSMYRALRKYWHNSRRAELNEALIWLGKVKWGSRSSPLRNAGTYATIYSTSTLGMAALRRNAGGTVRCNLAGLLLPVLAQAKECIINQPCHLLDSNAIVQA